MKYNYSSSMRLLPLLMIAIIYMLVSSCSRKLHFVQSTIVPAAEGTVKIKKDKNKNYAISISTLHLAEPERLQPPKKIYLVWMETDQSITKNIGQLKSSSGLFTKALKGSLSTVTPFQPKRIFITAEDDGTVTYPGGVTVLTTKEL